VSRVRSLPAHRADKPQERVSGYLAAPLRCTTAVCSSLAWFGFEFAVLVTLRGRLRMQQTKSELRTIEESGNACSCPRWFALPQLEAATSRVCNLGCNNEVRGVTADALPKLTAPDTTWYQRQRIEPRRSMLLVPAPLPACSDPR
jgi:hypothetical protein